MRATRPLYVALALAVFATPALAQFTSTVGAPRRERPETVQAREDSLRRTDSASVVERMTEMREWVDSAAVAIAADAPPAAPQSTAPTLPQDTSTTSAVAAGEVDSARAEPTVTTEFREGAPAPATATHYPALAVLGLASLIVGLALRRSPRRAEE